MSEEGARSFVCKFIAADGREKKAHSVHDFASLIESDTITGTTLLWNDEAKRWCSAAEFEYFNQIKQIIEESARAKPSSRPDEISENLKAQTPPATPITPSDPTNDRQPVVAKQKTGLRLWRAMLYGLTFAAIILLMQFLLLGKGPINLVEVIVGLGWAPWLFVTGAAVVNVFLGVRRAQSWFTLLVFLSIVALIVAALLGRL